jgi:HPt (histidine-containing phosphotransfer) domain-containing protein
MNSDNWSNSPLAATLATLWHKHAATILERLTVLEHAGEVLHRTGSLGGSERQSAAEAAHKLAGTLGTFGSPRGSDIACRIDCVLSPDNVLDDEGVAEIPVLISELKLLVTKLSHSYESTIK